MRRYLTLLLLVALAIAGCGGGHHARHAKALASGQSATGSVAPPGWGAPIAGPNGLVTPFQAHVVPATAEQFDTITLATVPRGARYLAGYTSGHWPTYGPLRALPWHPHVLSIAISASHHAQCLDIEPGDASPSQAATWYFAVKSDPGMRGSLVDGKPCEYSSLWEYLHQVRPVLHAAGISDASVWEWDADFTLRRHLDAGFDCTQWTDRALGLNLDESTCTLAFLGVHPTPAPKPKPKPPVPWSSAEIQVQGARPNASVTIRIRNGHWTVTGAHARVHSLPYGARPLGP